MKNQKGQALIEFLMLLPVLFFIIMAVFDFGNILYHRYKLENKMDSIVDLYANGEQEKLEEYLNKNHLVLTTDKEERYLTLSVREEISIYTPGLGMVLGSPCKIDASKTIYEGVYEQ